MKFSSAFVFTLLTGALAAPSAITDSDSEKHDVDVAARDFQDSAIANAVEARQVDTTVTLDERDAAAVGDAEVEDVEIVARSPKKNRKTQKKAKAANAAARGKTAKGRPAKAKTAKAKTAKAKTAKAKTAKAKAAKAKTAKAQAAKAKGNANAQGNGNRNGKGNGKGKAKAAKAADAAKPRVTNSLDAPGVV